MKSIRLLVVVVFLALLGANVQAADSSVYVGAKFGQMMVDESGFDDATNIGILVGYDLVPNISLEGELTTSVSDADVDFFGISGDWNVMTLALYGVFRTPGEFYFKGKAGVLYEDVEVDIPTLFSESEDDTGFSAGIGGGWRLNDSGSLEVEFTLIESDLNYLSLGYNIHF